MSDRAQIEVGVGSEHSGIVVVVHEWATWRQSGRERTRRGEGLSLTA